MRLSVIISWQEMFVTIDWNNSESREALDWPGLNAEVNLWYESLDFAQQKRFDVLRFSKEFQAHDRSHRQSDEIYAETERMANDLREAGHQFDSTWVTRPLEHDESIETVLCGHSEKLALAFHFIQKPPPTSIQLTSNLRMCGDCRL